MDKIGVFGEEGDVAGNGSCVQFVKGKRATWKTRRSPVVNLCKGTLRRVEHRNKRGLRFRAWLNSIRLELAYDRLLQSVSVKEVAYQLGYKQLSHFSREFKKFHGIAPTQVKKQQKNGESPMQLLLDV